MAFSVPIGPEAKRSLFEYFPHVCPEPVLAKCSFLYINGTKRPFLLTKSSTHVEGKRPICKGKNASLFDFECFPCACPEPFLVQ